MKARNRWIFITLILLVLPVTHAQPIPESGVYVGGAVTYEGERVDHGKLNVTISVFSTGYQKKTYTPPNPDIDYAQNSIKAEPGDYVVVQAKYKDQSTRDYIEVEQKEDIYLLDLEITDAPEMPPSTTTTSKTTTTTTSTAVTTSSTSTSTTTSLSSTSTSSSTSLTQKTTETTDSTSSTTTLIDNSGGNSIFSAAWFQAVAVFLLILGVLYLVGSRREN